MLLSAKEMLPAQTYYLNSERECAREAKLTSAEWVKLLIIEPSTASKLVPIITLQHPFFYFAAKLESHPDTAQPLRGEWKTGCSLHNLTFLSPSPSDARTHWGNESESDYHPVQYKQTHTH